MIQYRTDEFYSNCLFEAIKAKLKDWENVSIYFFKPQIKKNYFEMFHFMWSDGENDYDFNNEEEFPPYKYFWFKGGIRKLKKGTAERYLKGHNERKVNGKKRKRFKIASVI